MRSGRARKQLLDPAHRAQGADDRRGDGPAHFSDAMALVLVPEVRHSGTVVAWRDVLRRLDPAHHVGAHHHSPVRAARSDALTRREAPRQRHSPFPRDIGAT